jgi:putative transposase
MELLDEGKYLCSARTMYRILNEFGEVKDRRNQRKNAVYTKPELLAEDPKQVWSWDITKLKGPVKWNYYYLYVILDIYSRFTVGWMVADRESKELAKLLIERTYMREHVNPEQLIIHSDRGSSMKSKTLFELYTDLGVCRSLSRPRVSNDNPFSEAQFKTLKYKPEFPNRFGSIQDARVHCDKFFDWYNYEHKHSGIAYMTPDQMHHGLCDSIYEKRKETLFQAYLDMPNKFNRVPVPPKPPKAVWINPPDTIIQ